MLLVRLGTLLEESLGDIEGAIAVHDERLENDAADVDAMMALERLYERTERWQKLVQILKARDGVATDEDSRREIAKRIAKLYEEKLDDRENAIIAWNDVLASFGQDRETLAALARLYEGAERWSDLLETLGAEQDLLSQQGASAGERAESRFHAAELMRTRTNERDRAIEAYAEVLDLDPAHIGAIAALEALLTAPAASERIAAATVLVPRYEGRAPTTSCSPRSRSRPRRTTNSRSCGRCGARGGRGRRTAGCVPRLPAHGPRRARRPARRRPAADAA